MFVNDPIKIHYILTRQKHSDKNIHNAKFWWKPSCQKFTYKDSKQNVIRVAWTIMGNVLCKWS